MFITECRITSCLEDSKLEEKFEQQLATNSELKKLFRTPKEELVSFSAGEQKFWERFSGETYEMARSEDFSVDSYDTILKSGFTGRGYKEETPKKTKEVLANIKTDKSQVEARANAAATNDAKQELEEELETLEEAEALMGEVEINHKLREEVKRIKREGIRARSNNRIAVIEDSVKEARSMVRELKGQYQEIKKMREKRISQQEKYRSKKDEGKKLKEFRDRFSSDISDLDEYFDMPGSRITRSGVKGEESRAPLSTIQGVPVTSYLRAPTPKNRSYAQSGKTREEIVEKERNQALAQKMGDGGQVASPSEISGIVGGHSGGGTGSAGSKPKSVTSMNPSSSDKSTKEDIKGGLDPLQVEIGKNLADNALSLDTALKQITNVSVIKVPPMMESIDLIQEIIEHKNTYPDFELGSVLLVQQKNQASTRQLRARLIPLFDEDGNFKEYGINADKELREKIQIRSGLPIEVRFLTKSEALKYEMEIAAAESLLATNSR